LFPAFSYNYLLARRTIVTPFVELRLLHFEVAPARTAHLIPCIIIAKLIGFQVSLAAIALEDDWGIIIVADIGIAPVLRSFYKNFVILWKANFVKNSHILEVRRDWVMSRPGGFFAFAPPTRKTMRGAIAKVLCALRLMSFISVMHEMLHLVEQLHMFSMSGCEDFHSLGVSFGGCRLPFKMRSDSCSMRRRSVEELAREPAKGGSGAQDQKRKHVVLLCKEAIATGCIQDVT
jgi:hypothetical protein